MNGMTVHFQVKFQYKWSIPLRDTYHLHDRGNQLKQHDMFSSDLLTSRVQVCLMSHGPDKQRHHIVGGKLVVVHTTSWVKPKRLADGVDMLPCPPGGAGPKQHPQWVLTQ